MFFKAHIQCGSLQEAVFSMYAQAAGLIFGMVTNSVQIHTNILGLASDILSGIDCLGF